MIAVTAGQMLVHLAVIHHAAVPTDGDPFDAHADVFPDCSWIGDLVAAAEPLTPEQTAELARLLVRPADER